MNELALTKPETAVAPSPAEILRGVVQGGITPENVATVERIMAMCERMEARKAEQEFSDAFAEMQKELPSVQAEKPVKTKDGKTKYCTVNFFELKAQVDPILNRHGFSLHRSQEHFCEPVPRVVVTLEIQHRGGHKRVSTFGVRVGNGPPDTSAFQADGAAATYAANRALIDALDLRVNRAPEDARLEGDIISHGQAFELERRVKETNSNEAAFLKFAGAASFKEIRQANYDILDRFLESREKKAK